MDAQERFKPLLLPLLASLTLGLAPFMPLPHVVEKLGWLVSGRGLALIDVFDLLMHGSPWLWLLWSIVAVLRPRRDRTAHVTN